MTRQDTPFASFLRAAALLLLSLLVASVASADDPAAKFRQLGTELPTPNVYRNAAGAPGPQYWQQRADYRIEVKLDEAARRLEGSETITYSNRSPDTLRYLWVQLDQNRFRDDSLARRSESGRDYGKWELEAAGHDVLSYDALRREQALKDVDYGAEILAVRGAAGDLDYIVNGTMMRIDLPTPLASGEQVELHIDWAHNIVHNDAIGGRGGYEHFPESDTVLFFIAQWFPRMAAYTDYKGWQHHQFLGRGEFTLEFGDYDVRITVPADHVVSATGVLQNADEVLSAEQRERLARAAESEKPLFVVTPEEALANEKEGTTASKTWHFHAENVRDFAWSSSRKYIWDAMAHHQPGAEHEKVLVMSFYPNEGEPIWSQYSSHAVAHALGVYSRFSFAYPYPVAQSVNTWSSGGMEYPMITFNGYRPDPKTKSDAAPQGAYSRGTKYSLIGVIIHEIGHGYFPMTVNSDEREWTWMDEGLNTFLQYMSELAWEEKYPSYDEDGTNVMDSVTEFMKSADQVPVMTQSDSVLNLFLNAYVKPTAALVTLRETVMGRELFDDAFREYAMRWKFKRPTPADFFRTMEDASAVDLDWFWRGWFYSTDHVDMAVTGVRAYKVSTLDPDVEFSLERQRAAEERPETLTEMRNREEGRETRVQSVEGLRDFYNENDRFTVSNKDRDEYREALAELEDWERNVLERAITDDESIYFVDFENVGGLLTPLPLTINYADGTVEELIIPAEIWRRDSGKVTRRLFRDQEIVRITIDPRHQTPDTDRRNNVFPPTIVRSRIELYKDKEEERNLMADMLVALRNAKDGRRGRDVPLRPASR